MITNWDIYWITRLDYLLGFFISAASLGAITLIAVVGYGISSCTCATNIRYKDYDGTDPDYLRWKDDYWRGKKILRYALYGIIPIAMFVFGAIFTPTTREMVAIYALPSIVNNETVKEIPGNVANFINENLKAWAKDVTSESGE